MSVSLNKPAIGSTGWGTDVNDNWTTIEGAINLPKNYIGGLNTSKEAIDNNGLVIASGLCRDVDDTEDMILSSSLTKKLDESWVEGDGNGGLDTGTIAVHTLYSVWLIKDTSSGIVDALFSTSFTSPTMPSGYDKKRLIAAITTDQTASFILPYSQSGNYFTYNNRLADIIDSTVTAGTFETGTVSVPPDCLGNLSIVFSGGNLGSTSISVKTQGFSQTVGAESDFMKLGLANNGATDVLLLRRTGMVLVDGSSQIEYAANGFIGTRTLTVRTIGFLMLTRKEPG